MKVTCYICNQPLDLDNKKELRIAKTHTIDVCPSCFEKYKDISIRVVRLEAVGAIDGLSEIIDRKLED